MKRKKNKKRQLGKKFGGGVVALVWQSEWDVVLEILVRLPDFKSVIRLSCPIHSVHLSYYLDCFSIAEANVPMCWVSTGIKIKNTPYFDSLVNLVPTLSVYIFYEWIISGGGLCCTWLVVCPRLRWCLESSHHIYILCISI